MTSNGKQDEHAEFKQSFFNWANEQIAKNPRFIELKKLNDSVLAEARKRLRDQATVMPFAGYVDESGEVTLTSDAKSVDEVAEELRKLAHEGKIRAVCICKVIESDDGQRGTPMQWIELFLEHRDGHVRGKRTAIQKRLSVIENEPSPQGKGVPPMIFQD